MIPGVIAQQLLGIAAAPGDGQAIFVAVGSDNTQAVPVVMTSPDGTIWTYRAGAINAFPTADLHGVATNGSRWVAVGVDSNTATTPVILTSDDGGVTWISRTPDPATNTWLYAIAWTGTTFIAVGPDGSNSAPRVMTSPDGITWTARTADPATNMRLHGVSGISGLAVACGWTSTNVPKIMSSANDGASWTTQTSVPATQQQLHGVVCEPSRSVIVGVPTASTTTHIQSSVNGSTWTTETGAPSTGVDLYAVCHNGTLFVAVGTDHTAQIDPKIMTSPDGDTWTARTPDPSIGGVGGINLLGAASSGGVIVAVGRNQGFSVPYIMSSADGVTWVARTPSPTSNAVLNAVAGIEGVIAGDVVVAAAALSLIGQSIIELDDIGLTVASLAFSGSTITDSDAPTGPWSPAQISTLAWYDASDSNNVTLTGSAVDQWDDLSGNGNHVTQSTAGNKPTFDTVTNTINGMSVVSFDGGDVLTKATISGFPNNATGYTMVAITRIRVIASQRAIYDISDGALTNRTALIYQNIDIGGNHNTLTTRCGGTGNEAIYSDLTATDTINANLWASVAIVNKRQSFRNGTASTANTTAKTTYSATNLRIGMAFQDVLGFIGDIAELVLFSGENDTNRQLIEGYLAWKWGTVSTLDAGHPYKSSAP